MVLAINNYVVQIKLILHGSKWHSPKIVETLSKFKLPQQIAYLSYEIQYLPSFFSSFSTLNV